MIKRTMLALTFVAALGLGAIGAASPASAHGGCFHGGHGGYGGYRSHGFYGPAVTYRSFYGPRAYGPALYSPYYSTYNYGSLYVPFGHHRGGVSFSIGF